MNYIKKNTNPLTHDHDRRGKSKNTEERELYEQRKNTNKHQIKKHLKRKTSLKTENTYGASFY